MSKDEETLLKWCDQNGITKDWERQLSLAAFLFGVKYSSWDFIEKLRRMESTAKDFPASEFTAGQVATVGALADLLEKELKR